MCVMQHINALLHVTSPAVHAQRTWPGGASQQWQQRSSGGATCCARAHWPSVPKAVTSAVQDTTSGLMPHRARISSNSAAPRTQSPPAAQALMTAAKAWPAARAAQHNHRQCWEASAVRLAVCTAWSCAQAAVKHHVCLWKRDVRLRKIASGEGAPVGRQPARAMSSQMSSARRHWPPSAAARIAAVYACTEAAIREPAGAACTSTVVQLMHQHQCRADMPVWNSRAALQQMAA